MKTNEELNALKAEYESLTRKLGELTDDEMDQVSGGTTIVGIKSTKIPDPYDEQIIQL